mmetsp:Transcript_4731/g.13464  ORF Transcript_4731/g.13464 Transcript_4731/m.13464 type:complete len:564 (-) Transcript_4731:64-1755(-)
MMLARSAARRAVPARLLVRALSADAKTVFSPYADKDVPDVDFSAFLVDSMSQRDPNAQALLCSMTGDSLTYGGLIAESRSVAAALQRDFGFEHGSTLAYCSPNHTSFATTVVGALSFGGILSPANPLYSAEELHRQIEDSGAKALMAHPAVMETAVAAATEAGIPLILIGDDANAAHTYKQLATGGEDGAPAFGTKPPKGSDLAILPYSSGTTGMPKGVMLSHSNMVANTLQSYDAEGKYIHPGMATALPLPFFHIYGLAVGLTLALYRGGKVVFMPRFDFQNFLEIIQNEKVERAHVVPPIINALIQHPMVADYDLSTLTSILCAAAPLGAEQEQAFLTRFPNTRIKQAWGMTELSPAGTLVDDANLRPGSGTVGQLVSMTSARVIDPETEEVLSPTDTGELCMKGPQVMQGYLNRPESTEETFTNDGYMRTGDIGHFDEEGFMYVTDRCKELIKYKGFQVAPAELEALLLTHPEITDAIVIPRPCAEAGEIPRAYVVSTCGSTGVHDEKESAIQGWVEERVAPHKRLRGGVRFVEEVPKSLSGKLLRRVIRDMDREADEAA